MKTHKWVSMLVAFYPMSESGNEILRDGLSQGGSCETTALGYPLKGDHPKDFLNENVGNMKIPLSTVHSPIQIGFRAETEAKSREVGWVI